MALEAGRDYVFTAKTTYHGTAGIGDGCLLGTRNLVLMLPLRTMSGGGFTMTVRTYTLGGDSPLAVVTNLLSEPSLTVEDLEDAMGVLKEKFPDAALGDLRQVGRLKVATGWFSRGIYWNQKAEGLGGWTGYPLKGKGVAETFSDFYADHPRRVKK